jgi:hypothetical protein
METRIRDDPDDLENPQRDWNKGNPSHGIAWNEVGYDAVDENGTPYVYASRIATPTYTQNMQSTSRDMSADAKLKRRRQWKQCLIWICIPFLCIFILLAIVLPVLFVIRRRVDFEIRPITIDQETINIDPNGFTISVDPVVYAINDNFFNIDISMLRVEGSHPLYADGRFPLGQGLLEDVTLHSRSDTEFILPFTVEYDRLRDDSLTYFSSLLTNCSETGNRNLHINVDVRADYHMWAHSDTLYSTRSVVLPCPIDVEQAQGIQSLLENMGTILI